MSIKQQLQKILLEDLALPIDPALLTEERSIQAMGIDSMALVQLIYLLEDDYNITLATREVLDVATYGDLLDLLASKFEAAGQDAGLAPAPASQ